MSSILLGGEIYEISLDGAALVKAARVKHQVGDRKKDDKGREWEFASTNRWRLVRESGDGGKVPTPKKQAPQSNLKPKAKGQSEGDGVKPGVKSKAKPSAKPAAPAAVAAKLNAKPSAKPAAPAAVAAKPAPQPSAQPATSAAVAAKPAPQPSAQPAAPAAQSAKPTPVQQAARVAARMQNRLGLNGATPVQQAARVAARVGAAPKQIAAKLPTKEQVKHAIVHEADALSENVVAWKTGKLLGGAIAQYAIAHGVGLSPMATQIISETAVQASTATFVHAIKQKNSGQLDAKELAGYFVKQVAGAYLGKYSHFGTEFALEHLGCNDFYEKFGPIVAGKVTGISTVTGMGRYHIDSQIVNYVIDKGKHDVNLLLGLFKKKPAPAAAAKPALAKAADTEQFSEELQALVWDLTRAGMAIALLQNEGKMTKAAKVAPGQMSLFDASDHPRAHDGKFTTKGNSGEQNDDEDSDLDDEESDPMNHDDDAWSNRFSSVAKKFDADAVAILSNRFQQIKNQIHNASLDGLDDSWEDMLYDHRVDTVLAAEEKLLEHEQEPIRKYPHYAEFVENADWADGTLPEMEKLYDQQIDQIPGLIQEREDQIWREVRGLDSDLLTSFQSESANATSADDVRKAVKKVTAAIAPKLASFGIDKDLIPRLIKEDWPELESAIYDRLGEFDDAGDPLVKFAGYYWRLRGDRLVKASFEELKHPRSSNGKFARKGEGSATAAKKKAEKETTGEEKPKRTRKPKAKAVSREQRLKEKFDELYQYKKEEFAQKPSLAEQMILAGTGRTYNQIKEAEGQDAADAALENHLKRSSSRVAKDLLTKEDIDSEIAEIMGKGSDRDKQDLLAYHRMRPDSKYKTTLRDFKAQNPEDFEKMMAEYQEELRLDRHWSLDSIMQRGSHMMEEIKQELAQPLNQDRIAELKQQYMDEGIEEGEAQLSAKQFIAAMRAENVMMDVRWTLMDDSSISEEKASQLAKAVDVSALNERYHDDARTTMESFFLLTGGRGSETLKALIQTESRAYADDRAGAINIGWYLNPVTMFHEQGHHLEFSDPRIAAAAREWRDQRATGNKTELNNLVENGKYDAGEMAYPGNYSNPYVGKIYADGSTEVVSMGIETFASVSDMAYLFEKNPDHFQFIVGLLTNAEN